MSNHENCAQKTDNELVKLSLDNPDHFLCLIKRYESKLLHYIMRISKFRREDAGDILQDVFVKTYYNLNEFNPSLKFSSWIYRIAHNQTISEIRKKAVRPTVPFEKEDIDRFEDAFDVVQDIDNSFDRAMIDEALSKLDEKYREVLILRYLDEKDYVEIADILKKPVSTIGNLILRGKLLFKEEYNKLRINR
ncbi:MAG: sigma-70 family RNA polymerase sigma factor [Candidatus Paceibacterota bacterium]|jgi:RNA polymerase sigma-70 factor (ECF subfamily)